MQVEDLLAYQLVPSVVSAVRAAGIERLWPLQEKAVRAGALAGEVGAEPRALLLVGPSASGKTLLWELCAVQAAHSGRRVLCVVPTQAQAAAAAMRLSERYQRLGLRIAHLQPADEPPKQQEEPADVALMSAAAVAQRAAGPDQAPPLLSGIDLLVVDELEALADPRLGPTVELALLWLQRARATVQKQRAGRGPSLLALCAQVAAPEELASWLRADLIVDDRRPCEQRCGVVYGGRLVYFSSRDDAGSERRYEEELHEPPRPRRAPLASQGPTALSALVSELCMRGEQTLVLLPDRARAVIAAEQLTAALRHCPPAPAREALARLERTPDGRSRTLLRETLARGVAMLDPGMPASQRALVVAACRDGAVRVLCATDSAELDQGLSRELRFRNVIVCERWTWRYQRGTRGYAREALLGLDWARLSAPAAGAGLGGPAPGRVMLLAPSRFDAERMLAQWRAARPEPLAAPRSKEPLDEVVLSLVAGGAGEREAELASALAASYSGQARWSSPSGAAELRARVGSAVESLVAHELLTRDFAAGGVLRATPLGRAGAGLGLPVRTLLLMMRWADAAKQVDFTALEVLLALALSPSGAEAALPLLLSEQEASDYWSRTLQRAAAVGAAERPLFRWLRAQATVVRFEQTRALKKALLLSDWAAGRDGALLENEYHVWLGSIVRAAAEFARLVDGLAAVCALRGFPAAPLQALSELAEQLRQVPGESKEGRDGEGRSVVAQAVFSIRAAILAGRGAQAAPTQAVAAAASGPGVRAAKTPAAVADHAVEPT